MLKQGRVGCKITPPPKKKEKKIVKKNKQTYENYTQYQQNSTPYATAKPSFNNFLLCYKKIFKTVFRVMKNQTIGWTLTLKIVKFQTREKQPPTPPPKNKTKTSKPYKTPKSETPPLP